MRTCPHCEITKSIDSFQKCASKRSGVQSHCRECRNSTAAAIQKMHCSICNITMWKNKFKQHLSSNKHYYSVNGRPVLTKKRCPRCQQVKKIDSFCKTVHSSNGYTSYCRRCLNARARQRTRANNDRVQYNRSIALGLTCGIE